MILVTIGMDAFFSAVAALGFAMLFNVPRRMLWACVLAGAVGHAARTTLQIGIGWGIAPATFIGAAVVGLLSEYWARRFNAPAMLFAISGSIPLVPGVAAYRAMLAAINLTGVDPAAADATGLLAEMLINFIVTGLVLAAIALGTTLPILLFRRRKPVV